MRSICALSLLAGCTGMAELYGAPEMPVQQRSVEKPDAGDAGEVISPAPDAGVPDAGVHDAGTPPVVDAGAPPPHDAGPPFPMDAGHSPAEVCAVWAAGHVVTDPSPFTGSSATCDKGTLSRAGLDDVLKRLNMHRWLAGLGPVTDDPDDDLAAQACALISAKNPPGPQAHFPPPSAVCYTAEGAGAAGSSNIAWGADAVGSIEAWMEDFGNDTTFGHRRWFLNPPLGPVGMGYWEGGGRAACIRVFGSSGGGPRPPVIPYPPAGYVPLDATLMKWTVQGDVPTQDAGVEIHDSTGAALGASVELLTGNYGFSSAVRIDRQFTPRVGETYSVRLTGERHPPVEYQVKPIACP